MAGYIVYNGFWNPETPPAVVARLAAAAAQRGRVLTPLANTGAIAEIVGGTASVGAVSEQDFALFWDKDVRLARTMERIGMRLYNCAGAVAVCDDKAATHLALSGAGILMPDTLVAPMTYVRMEAGQSELFVRRCEAVLGFPMVVKECYGSLGGQVYLAQNVPELWELIGRMDARSFLCQRYIAAAHGVDVRIYVIDGAPVAAMKRRSDCDFRANIGNGGHGEAYSPTREEVSMAVESCRMLGLDFGGVDLLTDGDGRPMVCEVNASAHMEELERCTGVDVAGTIVEHVFSRENMVE